MLIEVDAPSWVKWTWSDDMYLKLSGLAPEGSLGSHPITVAATDSSGLRTSESFKLKVQPRLITAPSSEENYDFDSENWFGHFHLMDSGWCYHLDLGWIYLVPNENGMQLWFWKKGWGWSWTSRDHWSSTDKSGYLYVDQSQDWVYFTTPSNYLSARAYLYDERKWVIYSGGSTQ